MTAASAATGRQAPFDGVAADYDSTFTDLELGGRLRRAAWRWLDRTFGPGDRVLELGCGTGEDAIHLAGRGVEVVATDASERMLELCSAKVQRACADDLVRVRRLDLAEVGTSGWLTRLDRDGPILAFDGVFADFGALNCVEDRTALARGLAEAIHHGGHVVFVVMGPFCPWEVGWHLVHGDPRRAVRRWRSGASARLAGGRRFAVWYPSPATLRRELAPWFRFVDQAAIGVALPPSGLSRSMERRPGLLRILGRIEGAFADRAPAAWLADHYVCRFERA